MQVDFLITLFKNFCLKHGLMMNQIRFSLKVIWLFIHSYFYTFRDQFGDDFKPDEAETTEAMEGRFVKLINSYQLFFSTTFFQHDQPKVSLELLSSLHVCLCLFTFLSSLIPLIYMKSNLARIFLECLIQMYFLFLFQSQKQESAIHRTQFNLGPCRKMYKKLLINFKCD